MIRFKLLLASLPIWIIVIGLVYGLFAVVFDHDVPRDRGTSGSIPNKLSPGATKGVMAFAVVAGVAVYLGAKRLLGVKPAPRNRDMFELLRLPFTSFPNKVRVAVQRQQSAPEAPIALADSELQAVVERDVWPLLSADLFVCRQCGRRQSEFIASLDAESMVADIRCTECATVARGTTP